MTTIVFDAVLGPHNKGSMVPFGGFVDSDFYSLNDSNDAAGWKFVIPSNGSITDIGFFISNRVGTPPVYYAGLLEISEATGFPVAPPTPYGGSSLEYVDPPVGWNWLTLATPATAVAGDLAAIIIIPTSSGIPNTSNYISVCTSPLHDYSFSLVPNILTFTTAWQFSNAGYGVFAVRYNDGTVFGFPLNYFPNTVITTETTPDEVGCKFTLPFDVNCIGPSLSIYDSNTSEKAVKITLYDGNDTILRSITYLDSDEIFGTNTGINGLRKELKWSTPVSLTQDATYRLTYQNLTSVSGIGLFGIQFVDLASKNNNVFPTFTDWSSTVRTNSGVWTDNDLIVYDMGILIDSITVATSSGVPATTSVGGSYAYVG